MVNNVAALQCLFDSVIAEFKVHNYSSNECALSL